MNLIETTWYVCLRKRAANHSIISGGNHTFMLVPKPKHALTADPFIIEHDGKLFIFAELMQESAHKGVLAVCKYNGDAFTNWEVVINEEFHLAFPNMFKHNGKLYMIPDGSYHGQLVVYRCDEFPLKWTKVRIIAQGEKFADSVILDDGLLLSYHMQKDGNSLTLLKVSEGQASQLGVIASAPDTDKNLRPAGQCFIENGVLYRPAQDCKKAYGAALDIRQVTPQEGRLPKEEIVKHIEPNDIKTQRKKLNKIGIHTYNRTEHFEVVDIKVKCGFSVGYLFAKLKGRLQRGGK